MIHFMKAEMLDSQLATLESTEGEEGVVTVRLEDETEQQVADAVQGLKEFGASNIPVHYTPPKSYNPSHDASRTKHEERTSKDIIMR